MAGRSELPTKYLPPKGYHTLLTAFKRYIRSWPGDPDVLVIVQFRFISRSAAVNPV